MRFVSKFQRDSPLCQQVNIKVHLLVNVGELRSQKHASYSKSAAGLLSCSHQADIRMRSHRLLRLDDNKSVANCEQT